MKNMKKIIALLLIVLVVLTSTYHQTQKTQAAGLTVAFIVAGCLFVGSACLGAAYLANPDDNKDLLGTMKDFANDTVENQKKLYEIEKANFKMVMDKAVDAGVGTCLVGPNGVHITAKQLQQQEYPEFDTWKGYKEKESQKPSGSAWKKFELGVELADMLITLFQDKGHLKDDGTSEQLYYTGDDGYIDRETGKVSFTFNSICMGCYGYNYTESAAEMYTDKFYASHSYTVPSDLKENYRIGLFVSPVSDNYLHYLDDDGRIQKTLYRAHANLSNFLDNSGRAVGTFFDLFSVSASIYTGGGTYTDRKLTGSMYSCRYYEGGAQLTLYDSLSCNLPIFDSREHFEDYLKTGSLVGLINGVSDVAPTPTEALAPPPTVSPVRQYVSYFSGTFSPSVMPYYVNYNIVNNWDGNDTTFNINDYTGVLVPTLTLAPDADGNDINITNNLIINQVNILTEINETVTNIYNFFQIDVDYITEELQVDSDENPTGFDNLKNLLSEFESAFPADKFDAVTQELDLLYPKITIKVPKALDKFLKVGDDKIILEDGVKKIVLCDFNDYAIYFVRFRKFLEIVLRIGLIFYLLKELTVVFTVA